jgi:DNA-directed RNA polymerase specialized sigma24 family protein
MSLEIIHEVVQKLKKRKFGYFEEDDIAQEAYKLCLEIVEKWDGVRPLHNFLMSAVSNRLISLSRTYYRNSDYRRSIDFSELLDQPSRTKKDPFDEIDDADEFDYIINKLPPSMRNDFFRTANGVSISATRKEALFRRIREIHEEG